MNEDIEGIVSKDENTLIPPEHISRFEERLIRDASIKASRDPSNPSDTAIHGTMDKVQFSREFLRQGMAALIENPEFIAELIKIVTKHDKDKSVLAKAFELNLVAQFKELQKLRSRIHEEINEASRQMRQDFDKLAMCVEKTSSLLSKNDVRSTVDMAARLSDALTKLHSLQETGALEKMASALLGVK